MECKVKRITFNSESVVGFNRNIVECKAAKESGLEVVRQVLIETLWNVKAGTLLSCGPGNPF